ncbi:hypothetical protein EVAR_72640_1 [Eumeta japonica]|uniref:Uncharacterized protein n=1 Tax=Eumeta variegata TaxID=151549 RepID=A0A4C1SZV7_EUMVA|nr:hypothetical protein EVAR_72640_1 [Eumeta japonica]
MLHLHPIRTQDVLCSIAALNRVLISIVADAKRLAHLEMRGIPGQDWMGVHSSRGFSGSLAVCYGQYIEIKYSVKHQLCCSPDGRYFCL